MASTKLHLYTQVAILATVLFSLSILSGQVALSASTGSIWKSLFFGVTASCLLLGSAIYVWIRINRPYTRQSLTKLTIHFLLSCFLQLIGKRLMGIVLRSCNNPMKHQLGLLRRIISRNSDTLYGREHKLREITSLEEFRQRHPLTNYEHFRSYVERMIDGEKDILIKGAPTSYIRTTGTTGKSKHIPQSARVDGVRKWGSIIMYVYNEVYGTGLLKKCLYFYVHPVVQKAKDGVNIETAATMPEGYDWAFAFYVVPPAGYRIHTMHEALYVQLLFGLMDANLGSILAGFVHFLESSMKVLESHWEYLVDDIARGTLNPQLKLPQSVRDKLTEELRTYGGDPERAEQLRREFEKGFHGILKRIWPDVTGILAIDTTGSWARLRHTYAEGTELAPLAYGCSEAFMSVSPGPTVIDSGYLPMVDDILFEFIRENDMSSSHPSTFYLNEVEKGENYEVVVTQINGLYRYRMGDVVRIEGFYKHMPYMQFLYRTGQMLNLRYEKLNQIVVSKSIRAAVERWSDKILTEFAVAESTILEKDCSVNDTEEIMPYYLIFIELENSTKPVTDEEREMMDDELRLRNSDYERLRQEGSISHPRVYLVREGAFEALRDYLLANTGASANQYKPPRKLRTSAMVKVLLEYLTE